MASLKGIEGTNLLFLNSSRLPLISLIIKVIYS